MKFFRITSLLIAIMLAFGTFSTVLAADTTASVSTAPDKKNVDPLERLKAEKTSIQTQLSIGKITQEEADKKIAEIDKSIEEQEEFNSLTLAEKKTKLVSDYTTRINQMVKDSKMIQTEADKALVEYKAQVEKWDGSGPMPMGNMRGQRPDNGQKPVNDTSVFYKNAVVMQEGSLYLVLNGNKVKSTTKNSTVTPATVSKSIMIPID